MDRHELQGATPDDIAAAHTRDVAVQQQYGVEYVTYWFDYERQHAFCFARGPSRAAVEAVHREAHGQMAAEVIDVDEAALARFMGGLSSHAVGEAYEDSAFRAILFTDMVGSTDLTHYGPSFDFTPQDVGPEALAWSMNTNDRRMIELMLALRADEAVREAVVNKNACGGGAIAATLAACQAYGAGRATLLEHTASHVVGRRFGAESARDTVGYAGIVIEAAP